MPEAQQLLEDVHWCDDAYDAMTGADAVALVTEWNQFRALNFERAKKVLKAPLMIDLRNVYNPDEMARLNFNYSCIGRPTS
jgi:UDPglucose 6-dehydrogenase